MSPFLRDSQTAASCCFSWEICKQQQKHVNTSKQQQVYVNNSKQQQVYVNTSKQQQRQFITWYFYREFVRLLFVCVFICLLLVYSFVCICLLVCLLVCLYLFVFVCICVLTGQFCSMMSRYSAERFLTMAAFDSICRQMRGTTLGVCVFMRQYWRQMSAEELII